VTGCQADAPGWRGGAKVGARWAAQAPDSLGLAPMEFDLHDAQLMAKSRTRLRVQLTSARGGDDIAQRLARRQAEQVEDSGRAVPTPATRRARRGGPKGRRDPAD